MELTAAPLQAVKHAAAAGENTAIDSRVTAAEALVREVSVDGSTKTRGGTWVEAVAASGGGSRPGSGKKKKGKKKAKKKKENAKQASSKL